jgi:hypothetical protein
MVSISTLFAFWMVALALLWHRYCQPQAGPAPPLKHRAMVGAHMGIIVAAALGECSCEGWCGCVSKSPTIVSTPEHHCGSITG